MPDSTVHLEQIARVFTGHYERGSGADDPNGTHRLVFIGSIDTGPGHRLRRDRCPRFTPKTDPAEAVLRPGDLALPARGRRQDIALIEDQGDARPLVAASFLHVIRPDPKRVDAGYLSWWLNQPHLQARLRAFVRGSNMPFLPLADTRTIEVVLPPFAVQRRVSELNRLSIRESEIVGALRELRSALTNALALRAATGATA